MTYQAEADLARDPDFAARLTAGLCDEARSRTTEPLGSLIMKLPTQGQMAFMPFTASAPGFGDKYSAGGQASITDGDILSAIQANWDLVATVQFPPA